MIYLLIHFQLSPPPETPIAHKATWAAPTRWHHLPGCPALVHSAWPLVLHNSYPGNGLKQAVGLGGPGPRVFGLCSSATCPLNDGFLSENESEHQEHYAMERLMPCV